MKVETYKCDVCGKQKGEVNHWWVAFTHNGYFSIQQWGAKPAGAFSQLTSMEQIDNAIHLCGAECVQRKVSEFLSKVSP